MGTHEFAYALLPHAGGWREAGVLAEAIAVQRAAALDAGGGRDVVRVGRRPEPRARHDQARRAAPTRSCCGSTRRTAGAASRACGSREPFARARLANALEETAGDVAGRGRRARAPVPAARGADGARRLMRSSASGSPRATRSSRVPEHPARGRPRRRDELVVAGGGPAATAAVTLARLGVDVAFVGVVGDDDAGRVRARRARAEGVDVSRCASCAARARRRARSSSSPTATRSIVHRPGDAPFADAVDVDADWVHVDHAGYGAMRRGLALSLDGGNPIAGPRPRRASALYAPTEERLRADSATPQAALAAGAELVVVTRGAGGSVATTRDGARSRRRACRATASSARSAPATSSTARCSPSSSRGAALARGARAANTAASLSCRALDGRSAIPTPTNWKEPR